MAPLHPPIICRAKAIAQSAPDFFVTCRVACSLDLTWLLSYGLGSHTSAAPRHGHSGPRPFTRSNRFTPPGTLGVRAGHGPHAYHPIGPGRLGVHRPAPSGVRAGHGPPGYLPIGTGRLGVPVSQLLRPTRIRSPVTSLLGSGHSDTGRTHGSARFGS